jgi:hypothetical protein
MREFLAYLLLVGTVAGFGLPQALVYRRYVEHVLTAAHEAIPAALLRR